LSDYILWPQEKQGGYEYGEPYRLRAAGTSALEGILNSARKDFAPGIRTGFSKLDDAVRMSPGRLIVLGARPGTGKTTLATQIAVQILKGYKHGKVFYCSVEMGAAEIGLKALSCVAKQDCITPYLNRNEEGITHVESLVTFEQNTLARLHVYYGMRLEDILEACDLLKKNSDDPLLMVVVDFITSIQPIGEYATRSEAVGSVSKALKAMAKRLDVPVLCCAQLNRGTVAAKVPTQKDLRDSGEIEQDADSVLLLHKVVDKEGALAGKVEIIIAKNRFGTSDSLTLYPELHHHRFEEG
tara:strand:+ start:41 stop:934 length:894 start_codon:yes stop_codon:yes gene_type:complete